MDIAKNPSHHLSKRSQPDCDYRLEEPSYMKADGVDAWLKQWLKLQKKNKHPLVPRGLLDRFMHPSSTIASSSKGEVWKGKAHYIESDSSDKEEKDRLDDDGMDGEGLTNADHIADKDNEVCSDAKMLPVPPQWLQKQ